MKKEKIVWNLCDQSFKDLFTKIAEFASMDTIFIEDDKNIIQLGSYTCSNYFIKLTELVVDKNWKNFDLVIPVIPEHQLNVLESKEFTSCMDKCRQVVVNDFGVLEYLQGKHDIRMGRLFFKDYRDKRYEEYDSSEYIGKANAILEFVAKHNIRIVAYENDIITQNYSIPIDKHLGLYLHYPYRLISMSHICEYASIGKRIEDKYIPDDLCNMQCFHVNTKSDEYGYLKIGKCVYDILEERYLENIDSNHYLIITPRW